MPPLCKEQLIRHTRYEIHMAGDFASIFHTIMASQRPVDYDTILSTPNMAEANFVRSALSILTDPDDEDEHDSDVIEMAYKKLSDDYLRGIMTGIVVSIYADHRWSNNSMGTPAHHELGDIYEQASALLLERLGTEA